MKKLFLISDWNALISFALQMIYKYYDKKNEIFRAGCDSLPAVKPRAERMIRCDSGADSIVWMKEDDGTVILIDECSV